MATVTGKLISATGESDTGASIEFMLSGYGSWSPKGQGGSVGSFSDTVTTGEGGDFSVSLVGNDEINPPTTYYAVTIRNSNGDIIQCNAYQFTDGQSYDFDLLAPYDPNLPPPSLPPPVTNLLLIVVAAGGAAEFIGDQYTAWQITLDHDIVGAYLSNIVPGNLYTFIIIQDAVGGHVFNFPTGPAPYGTRNVLDVDSEPNSTSIQTFIADANGMLWAIGPGTYYP
jgi:hypothetical protein